MNLKQTVKKLFLETLILAIIVFGSTFIYFNLSSSG
jgi:hypothetical protein